MNIIASICLLLGTFLLLCSCVGFVRFRSFYNQLHLLSLADTGGLGLIALGCALLLGQFGIAVLCLFIWALVLIAGVLSGPILVRAEPEQEQRND